MAMEAPQEELAYVAILNPDGDGRPDALGVLDVDPRSSELRPRSSAGWTCPYAGDELHHFGWNACSAALCPTHAAPARRAALPARARPALVAHVHRRHQARPAPAADRQDHRAGRAAGQERLQPARTPSTAARTRSTSTRWARPTATGRAASSCWTTTTFDVKGPWEAERGPQYLAYDFWWHLGHDMMITSEWGTPNMVENGVNPELLLGGKYGHQLHVWDLRTRRHLQALDLGAEQQMVLELRPVARPEQEPTASSASSPA